MRFKRTLIVEQNREYVTQIHEMLEDFVAEVDFCFDGESALNKYQTMQPDLLFVEAILPKMDGFALLEKIIADDILKIMLTSINQDLIIKKAFELKADYVFVKPYSKNTFVPRLMDVVDFKTANPGMSYSGVLLDEKKNIYNRAAGMLKALGIPANIKGYTFLREAIVMACEDPSALESLNGNIYANLAKQFGTTVSNVERNMRTALETANERSDPQNYERYFGNSVNYKKGKPTNAEFIAVLVEKILLDR